MIQTILKIGQWQSEGKSEWHRFLNFPKVDTKDRQGNPIQNYSLAIVFDLNNKEITVNAENLKGYSEKNIEELISVSIKGGNNKAFYTAVEPKKINQIYKTFFGKEKQETAHGELNEAIEKLDTELLNDNFASLLQEIFKLKQQFIDNFSDEKGKISFKAVESVLELPKSENIALVYVQILSDKHGFTEPTNFVEIPEYYSFLEQSYLSSDKNTKKNAKQKMCYASGNVAEDIAELSLNARYSFNKMFVTETKNYANDFNNKNFIKNYQISNSNQAKLDVGSDYLLNQGYRIKIAGIEHVIVPQFRLNSKVDVKKVLDGLHLDSDLLFNLKSLKSFVKRIDRREKDLYWVNYIAYESDGNFFKSTGEIKDVNSHHLSKILDAFMQVDEEFKQFLFIDWQKIMTDYGKVRQFNFNSIFGLIPQRKDKEKKSRVLELFKAILENRKVEMDSLYDYFSELMLCHYYQRYKSYGNVKEYKDDYFYFAIRDSVFKYFAFFQFLQKLNLSNMDNSNDYENKSQEYDQLETAFFDQMNLNQNQQAMFYLGRMLDSVEYLQRKNQIKRTVIHKVNFDGIDKSEILRLNRGLIEKAKQYNKISSVKFTNQKFTSAFDLNNWQMNPKEALFFLLSGYSFNAKKQKETEDENPES